MLRYLVEIFFDLFSSWLSVLIFSLISKSVSDHQNPFFKTQNRSVSSLDADLKFFKHKTDPYLP